MRFTDLEK